MKTLTLGLLLLLSVTACRQCHYAPPGCHVPAPAPRDTVPR